MHGTPADDDDDDDDDDDAPRALISWTALV
jgi:hypothetical protein